MRKQRRFDELGDAAAALERRKRELAAAAQAARTRLALSLLANAGLRAEAAALSRRLAAARRALELGRLYAAAAVAGSVGLVDTERTGDDCLVVVDRLAREINAGMQPRYAHDACMQLQRAHGLV